MTVGRAILMYLVYYIHRGKQVGRKMNIQLLTKEYTILSFEIDLCGLRHQQDRYKRAITVTTACN